MQFEAVIGLELHAQLATRTKIFSGAPTAYGAEAHRQASALDLGMPGMLPVLNERAVDYAIRLGLALTAAVAGSRGVASKEHF